MTGGNTKVPYYGWLDAAREVLIEDGIGGLKADRLAKRLGVTRGGFYYHFKSLQGLLDALVEKWCKDNRFDGDNFDTSTKDAALASLRRVSMTVIKGDQFNPQFDLAMREWARVDANVLEVVRQADQFRLGQLHRVFSAMGFDHFEAEFHSKAFYYQKMGYYILGVKEDLEERTANLDYWLNLLDQVVSAKTAK